MLLAELRQYLHREVEISQHDQTQAKDAVETIKRAFKGIQIQSPFNFGQIFHQGSSYEGLKVIAPDEFDLMIPLSLNTDDWRIYSSLERGTSGYYRIEGQSGVAATVGNSLIDQGCLSPVKVRQNMQSTVQRAVNGMNGGMRINLSYSGPAITLDVEYCNGKKMSIDLVPALMLHGRNFVAKSPRHLRSSGHDKLWRESFSHEEKAKFNNMDRMNECHRDCLKILKTIQKKRGSSQLGMLSSYHLKTCMLHLDNDRPGLSWKQDKLAERFKDLLSKLIRFLENRNMPHFFCRSVNLFDGYDTDSLNNILGWLRGATRDDTHIVDVLLHERGFVRPVEGTFDIFVKNQLTNNRTKVYRQMQRSTGVTQLKRKVSTEEGIPVDQQILTFESKQLQDGKTLGDYNIRENSTIYLSGRLRGGHY